jgi:rhamnosyltransferase
LEQTHAQSIKRIANNLMVSENKTLPHVAVLMATYNGEKYIREQVDSILAQKNVRVTVFVRDDNSTDQTREIINAYHQLSGLVYLLDLKPAQLKVTRNFFSIARETDLADIDYIAYSDQDDVWLDNKLDAAIAAIRQNNVDCYASNLLQGDASGRVIKRSSVFSKLFHYFFNFKSNNQLSWDHYFEAASAGCTLVLNKKAGLYFQERLNEIYDRIPSDASHDWSTYAITRLGGYRWYIDSNAYIIYRQHSDNAYGTNSGMKGISKLVDLFSSGWYRRHILMIEDLYNNTTAHPSFIDAIRSYNAGSFLSRCKVAFAVSRHRRKPIHRILLFGLIVSGYFK